MIPAWPEPGTFARAVGEILDARAEEDPREERIDHVWITMDCGAAGRLLAAINTLSLRARAAGHDPRLRVGRLSGSAAGLPEPGCAQAAPFDYAEFEAGHTVFFEPLDRPAIEGLLLELARRSARLEVWGEFFRRRGRAGIHQIHCRRASSAVATDLRGRDGGLRFYRSEGPGWAWTLVLLKFHGQP